MTEMNIKDYKIMTLKGRWLVNRGECWHKVDSDDLGGQLLCYRASLHLFCSCFGNQAEEDAIHITPVNCCALHYISHACNILHPCVCLSIHLSPCLTICLSVTLSVCLHQQVARVFLGTLLYYEHCHTNSSCLSCVHCELSRLFIEYEYK